MTNEECAKSLTNYIERYFKGKLVYVLFFDDLSFLLEKEKIEKERFVGFTRDFPMNFGHGNVAVVFKRSKLRKKYKMIDIEYTEKFMYKNPLIKNHVLQGSTENEIAEKMVVYYEYCIQYHKNQPQTRETKSIISQYETSINMTKKYPLEASLRGFKNENETLIKRNIVDFNVDDVFCIIYPSKSFLKYYPVKEIYHEKMIFIDDYFPIEFEEGSPLELWYIFISDMIENLKKNSIEYNGDLTLLFLYVYGMSTDMKKFTKNTPREINDFPDDIDYILKNIHKVLNKEIKLIMAQFLSVMQIIPGWKGSEGQYEYVITKAMEQLKTME